MLLPLIKMHIALAICNAMQLICAFHKFHVLILLWSEITEQMLTATNRYFLSKSFYLLFLLFKFFKIYLSTFLCLSPFFGLIKLTMDSFLHIYLVLSWCDKEFDCECKLIWFVKREKYYSFRAKIKCMETKPPTV